MILHKEGQSLSPFLDNHKSDLQIENSMYNAEQLYYLDFILVQEVLRISDILLREGYEMWGTFHGSSVRMVTRRLQVQFSSLVPFFD